MAGLRAHLWLTTLEAGLLLLPWTALASGMSIPDLGAASLGQGAATIARPDDLGAAHYNPAGLAGQDGLRFHAELRIVDHRVRFQRTDAAGDPGGFYPVENQGGPSRSPLFGVSYRIEPRPSFPVTIAAGVIPFSGYTGYRYPDPFDVRRDPEVASIARASDREAEVADRTPQRYAAIASDSSIFMPFVAAAARVTDWMDVGFTIQAAMAHFRSSQAIYANLLREGEDSSYDGVFTVDAWDRLRPSAALGASFRLRPDVFAGLSFQLPMRFRARGTLTVEITPELESMNAELVGEETLLEVNFPWHLRAGVRLVRPAFEVELAGTYEAWSSFREIKLIPQDVAVHIGGQVHPLPELPIRKELQDAGSVRLGGVLRPGHWISSLDWLVLRGGLVAETSALPMHRQSLDIAHWERLSLNAGAGVRLGRYEAAVGYGYFIQPTRRVRNSEVEQIVAFPGEEYPPPTVVGNGNYDASLHVFGLMVSARI